MVIIFCITFKFSLCSARSQTKTHTCCISICYRVISWALFCVFNFTYYTYRYVCVMAWQWMLEDNFGELVHSFMWVSGIRLTQVAGHVWYMFYALNLLCSPHFVYFNIVSTYMIDHFFLRSSQALGVPTFWVYYAVAIGAADLFLRPLLRHLSRSMVRGFFPSSSTQLVFLTSLHLFVLSNWQLVSKEKETIAFAFFSPAVKFHVTYVRPLHPHVSSADGKGGVAVSPEMGSDAISLPVSCY